MEIVKGDKTFRDTKDNLVEIDGGSAVTCGCGNPQLSMVSHFDGRDIFGYDYNCQCGNIISVVYQRKDKTFW